MSTLTINPWTILSDNTTGGAAAINQPGRWVLASATSYPVSIAVGLNASANFNQNDLITTDYTENFTFTGSSVVVLQYQYYNLLNEQYYTTNLTVNITQPIISTNPGVIYCTYKPWYRHPDTEEELAVKGIIVTDVAGSYVDIQTEWYRTPGSGLFCEVGGKCLDAPDSHFQISSSSIGIATITIGYSNLTQDSTLPNLTTGSTIDVVRVRKSDNTNIDLIIDNTGESFDPLNPTDYADHVATQINLQLQLLFYTPYINFIPFVCNIDGNGKFTIITIPKKTAAADWIGVDYNNARIDVNFTSYLGQNSGPYVQVGGISYGNFSWTPALSFTDITCSALPSLISVGWASESQNLSKGGSLIYNSGIQVEYNDIIFINSDNLLYPLDYTFNCGLCEGDSLIYEADLEVVPHQGDSWQWFLNGDLIGEDPSQDSYGAGIYTVIITNDAYSVSCESDTYEEI